MVGATSVSPSIARACASLTKGKKIPFLYKKVGRCCECFKLLVAEKKLSKHTVLFESGTRWQRQLLNCNINQGQSKHGEAVQLSAVHRDPLSDPATCSHFASGKTDRLIQRPQRIWATWIGLFTCSLTNGFHLLSSVHLTLQKSPLSNICSTTPSASLISICLWRNKRSSHIAYLVRRKARNRRTV